MDLQKRKICYLAFKCNIKVCGIERVHFRLEPKESESQNETGHVDKKETE